MDKEQRERDKKGFFSLRSNNGDSLIYFFCFCETNWIVATEISCPSIPNLIITERYGACCVPFNSSSDDLKCCGQKLNPTSGDINNSYFCTKDPRNNFTF